MSATPEASDDFNLTCTLTAQSRPLVARPINAGQAKARAETGPASVTVTCTGR